MVSEKNMPFDPYDTLKVSRNASKKTIQKAYRRLARATHPDSGGDSDAFKEVHWAYELLMDDARRAHYDATGEVLDTKITENADAEVIGVLSPCFVSVVVALAQRGVAPPRAPVLDMMRDQLNEQLDGLRRQRLDIDETKRAIDTIAGRFTVTDGANLMAQISDAFVANQQASLRNRLAENEKQTAIVKRALEVLAKAKYRKDGDQNAWTTSTSGQVGWIRM